jgi:YegS/Rv2252/BmrU family lipid kinase
VPVCLLVNPSAGGGRARKTAPGVQRRLRELGLEVRRQDTRDLEHARALAGEAARAGETVAVLSGDGMIGAVADALREVPGAVLGVLPGGRGNDLARVLGISQDPLEACATIARGVPRAIDMGEVNGRAFVGIASVGFDSDANRIANEAPSWLGNLVYVYGALRALIAWRPARFEIELDPPGERVSISAYTVGAANSRAYGGGMRAAPDALLDDGLLDVLVLESVSKVAFVTKILPKVFSGKHMQEPGVRVWRAREVSVEADRPFDMYADGDPIGELPVRVRALTGAVTMLVPESTAAGAAFGSRGSLRAPAASPSYQPSSPSSPSPDAHTIAPERPLRGS